MAFTGWFANKKKSASSLEQLLQTSPTFPGVPLHVCTEDVALDEIEKVRIPFPVHIRDTGLTRKNKSKSLSDLGIAPIIKELSVSFGSSLDQGKREYMEDRIKIIENLLGDESTQTIHYFAVFDGHAGNRAADIAQSDLHNTIKSQGDLQTQDPKNILTKAIKAQDKYIIEKGTKEGWTEGSCVSIVLLKGKTLFSANLGDSHMVLAHRNNLSYTMTPIRISETHKATEEAEKKRITSAGGMVMRGRVFGDLSISRALGDLNYKIPKQEVDYVSSDAFIAEIALSEEHVFVILASDGLWDKLTFQEAIEMVHSKIKSLSATELSQLLLNEAITRGSVDNISVIVVLLHWNAVAQIKSLEIVQDTEESLNPNTPIEKWKPQAEIPKKVRFQVPDSEEEENSFEEGKLESEESES